MCSMYVAAESYDGYFNPIAKVIRMNTKIVVRLEI